MNKIKDFIEIAQKNIENEIKNMKKGEIFTFGKLLEKNNITDLETKFNITSSLIEKLSNEIEIYEEDKNAVLGPIFVFRYKRK